MLVDAIRRCNLSSSSSSSDKLIALVYPSGGRAVRFRKSLIVGSNSPKKLVALLLHREIRIEVLMDPGD